MLTLLITSLLFWLSALAIGLYWRLADKRDIFYWAATALFFFGLFTFSLALIVNS